MIPILNSLSSKFLIGIHGEQCMIHTRKLLSFAMVFIFTILTVLLPSTRAAMVPTAQVIEKRKFDQSRRRLNVLLNRSEVQAYLQEWGVDGDIAKSCIEGLTDEEVTQIVQRLDRYPAGGDGVGAIVGAAVLIFLVLLITDILGFTDVFPFVKKQR
jgi:hypothetical protein